jgi:hypothetical protein
VTAASAESLNRSSARSTSKNEANLTGNGTLTKREAEMLDHSEILIRVAQVQRSITDRINARDIEGARALADELLWQARQLQMVLRDDK